MRVDRQPVSEGRPTASSNELPPTTFQSCWGERTFCLAQEWQRDGRGLWAMRACRYYIGHAGPRHDFGAWRYNVRPPSSEQQAVAKDSAGSLPDSHSVGGGVETQEPKRIYLRRSSPFGAPVMDLSRSAVEQLIAEYDAIITCGPGQEWSGCAGANFSNLDHYDGHLLARGRVLASIIATVRALLDRLDTLEHEKGERDMALSQLEELLRALEHEPLSHGVRVHVDGATVFLAQVADPRFTFPPNRDC